MLAGLRARVRARVCRCFGFEGGRTWRRGGGRRQLHGDGLFRWLFDIEEPTTRRTPHTYTVTQSPSPPKNDYRVTTPPSRTHASQVVIRDALRALELHEMPEHEQALRQHDWLARRADWPFVRVRARGLALPAPLALVYTCLMCTTAKKNRVVCRQSHTLPMPLDPKFKGGRF